VSRGVQIKRLTLKETTLTDSASPQNRLHRLLGLLQLEPGNLQLRQQAILEAWQRQEWGMSRELIDDGLTIHPANGHLLAQSGLAFLHASSYAEAEAVMSAAAQSDDAPAWNLFYLAYARFKLDRYELALEALSSTSLVRSVPAALLLRARCQHHLNRREEAIADCKSHLLLSPHDADTHGLLALISYELQDERGAATSAHTALRLNPNQREALLALGSVHADNGDGDAALQAFTTLAEAHPDCGRGWLGLAMARLTDHHLSLARSAASRAVALLPNHIGAWHVLAWVDIIQGDLATARISLEHALELNRNFGETHGSLAVVAAIQGMEQDAELFIKKTLRLAPQSMAVRCAEIILLLQRGQEREAQAVMDAFLDRPSSKEQMHYRNLAKKQMERFRQIRAMEVIKTKPH
jgi:tetratricopeptide (TPR) repeat protein